MGRASGVAHQRADDSGLGRRRNAGAGSAAAPARECAPQGGGGLRKKSRGVLREGVAVKYACIARHRREHPVRLMCRVLAVAPAGFYAWRKRSPSAHAIADERLMLNVRVAFARTDGRYGAPRIHRDLREEGIRVGNKRVARLMREDGLVARRRRRRVRTTDSAHSLPVAPNLLDRQFDVNGVRINQVWVSDLTYIPTREGWLYLATVLDLASRRVVGWAMADTLASDIALRALRMAIGARRPTPGLIHHSD